MTQKTISLQEEVYNSLKIQKQKKETFSDVISRLIQDREEEKTRPDISTFFGKLEEAEEGEWDKIEKEIYKDRIITSNKKILTLND